MLGFTNKQWSAYFTHKSLVDKYSRAPIPHPHPLKTFKAKFPQIPKLSNYQGVLPDSFWECWSKRTYQSLCPVNSWICPDKLQSVAHGLGYNMKDEQLLRSVEHLKGADLRCRGPGRLPTKHPNSDSAYSHGDRVCDSIQGWINDNLCFGPLTPEEMPWSDYTVNPITTKLKPNGNARVCVNMSAPYKKVSDKPDTPASVNSGIDGSIFPAKMSSTTSFCTSLMRAGCPAEMSKSDWNQGIERFNINSVNY